MPIIRFELSDDLKIKLVHSRKQRDKDVINPHIAGQLEEIFDLHHRYLVFRNNFLLFLKDKYNDPNASFDQLLVSPMIPLDFEGLQEAFNSYLDQLGFLDNEGFVSSQDDLFQIFLAQQEQVQGKLQELYNRLKKQLETTEQISKTYHDIAAKQKPTPKENEWKKHLETMAGDQKFSSVDDYLEAEIERINNTLAIFLAEQAPDDIRGHDLGRSETLHPMAHLFSRFTGDQGKDRETVAANILKTWDAKLEIVEHNKELEDIRAGEDQIHIDENIGAFEHKAPTAHHRRMHRTKFVTDLDNAVDAILKDLQLKEFKGRHKVHFKQNARKKKFTDLLKVCLQEQMPEFVILPQEVQQTTLQMIVDQVQKASDGVNGSVAIIQGVSQGIVSKDYRSKRNVIKGQINNAIKDSKHRADYKEAISQARIQKTVLDGLLEYHKLKLKLDVNKEKKGELKKIKTKSVSSHQHHLRKKSKARDGALLAQSTERNAVLNELATLQNDYKAILGNDNTAFASRQLLSDPESALSGEPAVKQFVEAVHQTVGRKDTRTGKAASKVVGAALVVPYAVKAIAYGSAAIHDKRKGDVEFSTLNKTRKGVKTAKNVASYIGQGVADVTIGAAETGLNALRVVAMGLSFGQLRKVRGKSDKAAAVLMPGYGLTRAAHKGMNNLRKSSNEQHYKPLKEKYLSGSNGDEVLARMMDAKLYSGPYVDGFAQGRTYFKAATEVLLGKNSEKDLLTKRDRRNQKFTAALLDAYLHHITKENEAEEKIPLSYEEMASLREDSKFLKVFGEALKAYNKSQSRVNRNKLKVENFENVLQALLQDNYWSNNKLVNYSNKLLALVRNVCDKNNSIEYSPFDRDLAPKIKEMYSVQTTSGLKGKDDAGAKRFNAYGPDSGNRDAVKQHWTERYHNDYLRVPNAGSSASRSSGGTSYGSDESIATSKDDSSSGSRSSSSAGSNKPFLSSSYSDHHSFSSSSSRL